MLYVIGRCVVRHAVSAPVTIPHNYRCISSSGVLLLGAGALTAYAGKIVQGSAAFAGAGSVRDAVSPPVIAAVGSATFAGAGALTAYAGKIVQGSATSAGAGSLTAYAGKVMQGAATLAGAGTLSAAAQVGRVVSLLHFDGTDASTTFTDETGKTWTANGNAQIDTAQLKFGTASGLFDGTGDYITTPDSADFAFGTGNFTLEFWMRPNTTAAASYMVHHSAAAGYGFEVFRNGTAVSFYASTNGSSWDIASNKTIGTVATNTWYHVAVTRSGDTWYTFLDGVQGATWSSSSALYDSNQTFQVGAWNGALSYDGWIEEFRMAKGIAVYTADFTPPASPFTYP